MTATSAHAAHQVAFVWDDDMLAYDFGPNHPLAPVRVELTAALIRSCGLVGVGPGSGSSYEVRPEEFDGDRLRRVHREEYIAMVRALSKEPDRGGGAMFGLGPGDTPAFRGMHDAASRVCAATVEAARQVWAGSAVHAFNPAGGLHHAMPGHAAGFCVYNDPAVAIDWLLDHGAERICYVDVDVHHGDGVERMFWDDPRVLTISLHESGKFLFPGTGAVTDIGGAQAPASAVNAPLLPGTSGKLWLEVFDAVIDPIVRASGADILVTQLGCDTHALDPLAHLAVTVDDMAAMYERLHGLAHEVCDGRWLATGGGGYRLVDVVPRAWTLAFAEMTNAPPPVDTPMAWRELVVDKLGATPPRSFTDDPPPQTDEMRVATRRGAEQTIDALRDLVFRRHGVRR
ncbi:MAG: acetoin utilization protein AcuC [Nitriliruptoraceae bacterium]